MGSDVDFSKIISDDREARAEEKWSGTFVEYLEKVKEDPSLAKLAHLMIYDTIMAPGVTEISTVGNLKFTTFSPMNFSDLNRPSTRSFNTSARLP